MDFYSFLDTLHQGEPMQFQMRNIVWQIIIVFAAACINSNVLAANNNLTDKDKVATVNGKVISRALFEREINGVRQRIAGMGKQINKEQMAKLNSNVLENLIGRELLYQKSLKEGIKADQNAVDKQFMDLKGQFPNEDKFQEMLSTMKITETVVKSDLERMLTVQRFIEERISKKIIVPDSETKSFYDSEPGRFKQPEQVQASHILIKVDQKAGEAAKKEAFDKINMIKEKLRKGEDFAALAKEFSQCPSNAKGGDLGYFRHGQMVKPFEDAAFALKEGEMSEPVETIFGFHLIKVTGKKQESITPYDTVKERIALFLKQKKVQTEVGALVEKLKESDEVKRYLPTS